MPRALRFPALIALVVAVALVATGSTSAAGGGSLCGSVTATDKGGDTAKFRVKSYVTGCNRASKGVKRYYRQTNGEQGKQLTIKGFVCGPLQPYKVNKLAFQCRSKNVAKKRYKAKWVSKK